MSLKAKLVAAAACLGMFATLVGVAAGDTLTADADSLVVANQGSVSLAATPSQTLTHNVALAIQCTSKNSHMGGTTSITFDPAASSTPAGGTLNASNVSISKPSGWPADGTNCPTGLVTAPVNSTVALGAPAAAGTYTYTVKWRSSDGDVVASSGTVQISLVVAAPNTPPHLSLPLSQPDVEATGPAGAVVSYAATATDAEESSLTPRCSPASGSVFAIGTTPVQCSVTDNGNLSDSGSFSVTVVDTTDPTLSPMPADQTVEATGPAGAVASWTAPTATDVVDVTVPVVCLPDSGSTFAVGTTTVTCTATDSHNNEASDSFTVTVRDTTSPVFSVSSIPANQTVEATSPAGARATWIDPTASDIVDGTVVPRCSPASGATFDLGQTTVTCTATDSAGNSSIATFLVSVVDTTPPAMSGMPSNRTVEATGPSGATSSWSSPTATDIVDGAVGVVCDYSAGDTFVLGSTTVSCTATDAAGNAETQTFTVTVEDTTAPTGITWVGGPAAGGTYYYPNIPARPTCTATDVVTPSPACVVSDYSSANGTHTMTATATDGAGNHSSVTRTFTVAPWTVTGFSSPVDMGGVYNTIKAGSTVPLKFEVFVGSTELTNASAITAFVASKVACSTGVPTDDIEILSTGGTSLRYDTTVGQFIQNWKIPVGAGTCYSVRVTTQDGSSSPVAFFKTK